MADFQFWQYVVADTSKKIIKFMCIFGEYFLAKKSCAKSETLYSKKIDIHFIFIPP